MSTLNNAMDYMADYHNLKKITSITYPKTLGSPTASYTVLLNSSNELKTAKEVILELGGQNATTYSQFHFVNTGEKTINQTYGFMFDTGTSSNNLSSSYLAAFDVRVNFSTGSVEGRQICKKNNGTQYYLWGIYYR